MKLHTTKEISSMFNIPEPTLRGWRCDGTGPRFYKLPGSRKVMYDAADVEQYVRNGMCEPSLRARKTLVR